MEIRRMKTVLILTAVVFAGMVQAGTLFYDNFNYPTGKTLHIASNSLWSCSSDCAIMDANWASRAFFYNETQYDQMRIARVDSNSLIIADCNVNVDAYSDPCEVNYDINWYSVGRISPDGSNWVACGAVLADWDPINLYWSVYARLKDSTGAQSLDYLVTNAYFKYLPIKIDLKMQGSTLTGTVTHGWSTATISMETAVLAPGKVGFAGQNPYGKVKGSFDNFTVQSLTPICGDAGTAAFKAGDLNKDCYVNMTDTIVFVNDWLKCTDPANSSCEQYW